MASKTKRVPAGTATNVRRAEIRRLTAELRRLLRRGEFVYVEKQG